MGTLALILLGVVVGGLLVGFYLLCGFLALFNFDLVAEIKAGIAGWFKRK